MRSSLCDYIEENDQNYHRYKAGTYMLPNDETEQERLDLQHHLFLLALKGRLYLAPIGNIPLQSTSFPSANVVGTDLSPIQPLYNLRYFKDHVPVFQSAFNASRSGVYFEMQDVAIPFRRIDDSMKGTAFERWLGLWYFEEVGFVDIVEKQLTNSIMLGAWTKKDVLSGLHRWSAAVLTRGLPMSPQEVEILLVEVKIDINSNWLHAYLPM
ncbi:hypothetical protein F5882DRAFT_428866 [Hyaloscypha sp. PMI_1271]|nr:hypothetical protein F5882DRAFT_428866 [Hyaloscypha sp. PMI_1271]